MKQVENIVIINDFEFINGGTSQIAINTANGLAGIGCNVYFFSAVSDASRNDLAESIIKYCTHQHDILKNPNRSEAVLQGVWNIKAARQLRSLLETLDPGNTVVHVHGWIKALSPSIGLVLKQIGFASILTLHDYFVACPNGGFFNYQTNKICNLIPMSAKCICTNCDARNYPQKIWRVVRQSVQNNFGKIPKGIKNFIAVTAFSQRILTPYLPGNSVVYNISNPVNYPFPNPKRANTSTKKFLFVGRLSTEKGVELACEAALLSDCKLTVIGDGELSRSLRELYPKVVFKGWLPPDEVFKEMLESTALVFPSILYETQGLSVLEAFSVGLPVIVSDKCAASESVNDYNGVLFRSGDSADLANRMLDVINDPAKTEERSVHIFNNYWQNPNTMEKYLSKLVKTYQHIMEDRPIGAR